MIVGFWSFHHQPIACVIASVTIAGQEFTPETNVMPESSACLHRLNIIRVLYCEGKDTCRLGIVDVFWISEKGSRGPHLAGGFAAATSIIHSAGIFCQRGRAANFHHGQ